MHEKERRSLSRTEIRMNTLFKRKRELDLEKSRFFKENDLRSVKPYAVYEMVAPLIEQSKQIDHEIDARRRKLAGIINLLTKEVADALKAADVAKATCLVGILGSLTPLLCEEINFQWCDVSRAFLIFKQRYTFKDEAIAEQIQTTLDEVMSDTFNPVHVLE